MVVIALRQIQHGDSRAHADVSPEFKMARVDASTGWSSSRDASVNSQDGGHARDLDGGASIYNSRWRAPSLKFNVATA